MGMIKGNSMVKGLFLGLLVAMQVIFIHAADPGAAEKQRVALTEMLFAAVEDQGADMVGGSGGALSDLIAAGADTMAQNDTGMSPLMMLASLQDFEGAQEVLDAVDNPKELAAQTNDAGQTALDIARQKKDAQLVGLLEPYAALLAPKAARKVG